MQFAEVLPPTPNLTWTLARQAGCTHAVSSFPSDGAGGYLTDFTSLQHQKQRFADAGLDLVVIETGFPWLDLTKRGLPGRDEEIERARDAIRNMGAVGIPISCWNWMAVFNWTRTSTTTPARGGAKVTSYDHSLMKDAPLTPAGIVTDDQLWDALKYFLDAVVPVAEESGVYLALHPDDPPISPIRGVSRIIRSREAMQRALDLRPSPNHGITMCQGTFSTMGANIPETIRHFAKQDKMFFVHFRDVQGTPEKFVETFHDLGQTDMFEAMQTYVEQGFTGPMRPDHVPTLEGEQNLTPGYDVMGRLYALGYLRGLQEAAIAVSGKEKQA